MTTHALHDLRSPLMSVLTNAEYLEDLARDVPTLRELLANVPLPPHHRRMLDAILDELQPVSADLVSATRKLDTLIEQLTAAA
jgi:signal transduction histidine kinase